MGNCSSHAMRFGSEFILLYLHILIGQTRSSENLDVFPSCLMGNVTWDSNSITGLLPNIDTPEECQTQCTDDCAGFTWFSKDASPYHNLCVHFSNLEQEIECTDCVSGPAQCMCSKQGECGVGEDNLLNTFPNIQDEMTCYKICEDHLQCQFYTYFLEGHILQHICLLFSSCEVLDESCEGCVTGQTEECHVCDYDQTVNGQCVLGQCKDGWTSYNSNCYKLFTGSNGINSYREVCQAEGGDLASVHSQEENTFLTTLLRVKQQAVITWIGGYNCNVTQHKCTWFDHSNWDWYNWASDEPDADEGCVFLGYNYNAGVAPDLWFDGSCSYDHPQGTDGICKISNKYL